MAGGTRSGRGQTAGPGEELPPPPTMAEVLMTIERNRAEDRRLVAEDRRALLEVIARNTSVISGASGSGLGGGAQQQGGGHQHRGGLAEFLRT